jgi:hypothetical protein
MARYLVLWRRSPTAWPTDPLEYSNLVSKFGALVQNWMKKGEMKEHAHFLDGTSGYTIWEVEAKDLLRNSSMLVHITNSRYTSLYQSRKAVKSSKQFSKRKQKQQRSKSSYP